MTMMAIHKDTAALVTAAHGTQSFNPATVKMESDSLLDLIEEIELAARTIERQADDVQMLAATGDEDPSIAGTVALYKSKAGVMLRDAGTLRKALVEFRSHVVEFQRADRQIRASLKNAGNAVPDADLTAADLATAPTIGG